MPYPFQPHISLKHAPTLWQGLHDDNPVRLFVGPLGSGKTTFCCAEVFSRALQQHPSPDGVRRFKAGIIRNTMPELKRTTIPTWLSLFPEIATAPFRWSSPAQHVITVRPRDFAWNPDGETWAGAPGLELIAEFFALDQPKDVRELLSWEGTMIWFNEVREIPKPIIDMADLRVGRYPSEAKGSVEPTWFGIVGDTNPPDEDHWIYEADKGLDEHGEYIGRPLGWSFYFQPPAVVEVQQVPGKEIWRSVENEPIKLEVMDRNHVHRAAGSLWAVNPMAENLPNLIVHKGLDPAMAPLGRGSYYARGIQNKARDWIRAYFQGRYQFVKEGKPVIEEFDPLAMVVDEMPVMENSGLIAGADIGGNTLNPAAVFFQRGPRGIWLVHAEVVASGMGLDRFETEMGIAWADLFGDRRCETLWGDPAGRTRDGIFETVAFDHLLSKGWPALPAPTQNLGVRIDAIKAPMGRYIDGKPGILIHRRCAKLIKGLSGAWQYRRLETRGRARYSEKPDKSHPYSDVCEGLGYGLSGAGETKMASRPGSQDPMTVPDRGNVGRQRVQPGQAIQAQTDFDVFSQD